MSLDELMLRLRGYRVRFEPHGISHQPSDIAVILAAAETHVGWVTSRRVADGWTYWVRPVVGASWQDVEALREAAGPAFSQVLW